MAQRVRRGPTSNQATGGPARSGPRSSHTQGHAQGTLGVTARGPLVPHASCALTRPSSSSSLARGSRFCKCRKCGSCASLLSASKTATAAAPAGAASKTAPASKQLRLPCKSKEAGDFSYRTCAPFCQVSKATGHCLYCKCADCHYCAAMATPAGPRDRGEAGPARAHPVSRLVGQASPSTPLRPATATPSTATPHAAAPAGWAGRVLMLLAIACLPTLLLLGWHALAPAHLSPHALLLKLREQTTTSPDTTTTAADRLFTKVDSRANLVVEPAPLPGHGSGTHAQPAPSPHTAVSPASRPTLPALPAHEHEHEPAPSRFAFW